MATVPAAAATWIATYLRNSGNGEIPAWKERNLSEGSGLNGLTIKQLKAILMAVQPFAIVTVPGTHAKKAAWVASVRRAFFTDEACTHPDVGLISHLPTGGNAGARAPVPIAPRRTSSTAQPISNAAAAAAIASAMAATHRQSTNAPPASRGGPQSLARQSQTSSSRGPQSLAAVRRPTKKAKSSRGPQSLARRPGSSTNAVASRQQQQAQNMAMQQAAAARYLSSSAYGGPIQVHPPYPYMEWMPPSFYGESSIPPQSSFTSSAPPTKAIKQEPGTIMSQPAQVAASVDESYWETRPKNPQEQEMLQQLRQMGFDDVREMLTGIRHVCRQQQEQFMASQVEAAMMWIVSQREEAEEAKKLDAARARSEALRAEQARLRKQAAHDRLWSTSLQDWISESDLFRGSIVLKEARDCLEVNVFHDDERKKKLIRFLELEKKVRKWYGTSVPWCYLCDLCEQWKSLPADELVGRIDKDATTLESSMYSLSEQQGGVPIIFAKARSTAEKNGRPLSPIKEGASTTDSDDDDVVIVLTEVSAGEADSRTNSSSTNGGKSKCEVIDLL